MACLDRIDVFFKSKKNTGNMNMDISGHIMFCKRQHETEVRSAPNQTWQEKGRNKLVTGILFYKVAQTVPGILMVLLCNWEQRHSYKGASERRHSTFLPLYNWNSDFDAKPIHACSTPYRNIGVRIKQLNPGKAGAQSPHDHPHSPHQRWHLHRHLHPAAR